VIADGKNGVILNNKLNTSDLYPLSKTPLKLLLDERIDLSGGQVTSVKEEARPYDDQNCGQAAFRQFDHHHDVRSCFEGAACSGRSPTPRAADTTVMIYNVKTGVKIDPAVFTIDYRKNIRTRTSQTKK
jgi:outer membrane lipoprotein-sorting protein